MQLSPEQINEFLAKSVLESQIGAAVKEAVARSVASLSKSYDNPFDTVVRNAVVEMIRKELDTTYRAALEEKVKAAMSTAITDTAMHKIVQLATDQMRWR